MRTATSKTRVTRTAKVARTLQRVSSRTAMETTKRAKDNLRSLNRSARL